MENQKEEQSSNENNPKSENNVNDEHSEHHEHKHKEHELSKKINELENKNKSLSEKTESLEKELNESKKLASQYLSTASYYKSQAETNKKDFERYKERNKDIESQAKSKANETVAKKILPILDSFDQAISQVDSEIMKGFSMIYSSLQNILTELGVVQIECYHDELNPELHNCISTENTDDEALDGHVACVYQKGYKFADSGEVIRPATVSVYKK